MKYKTIFCTCTALCILASCSNGSDNEQNTTPAELLGSWKLDCYLVNSGNPSAMYQTIEETITQGTLISVRNSFTDPECANVGFPIQRTLTLKTTYNGKRTNTVLGDSHQLDLKLVSSDLDGEAQDVSSSTTIYSIVLLLDGVLYYGKPSEDSDGESESARHSILAQEFPYNPIMATNR